MSNRPALIMDNWLSTYGYDKNRTTGDNAVHLCYALIGEWNGDQWVNRWRMAGGSGDVEETVSEAFEDIGKMLQEAHKQELRDRCPQLNAVLLMSHGYGRWFMANPDTEEIISWDQLSDEQRLEALDGDINFEKHSQEPQVPVRVVNLVTPEGLAGEVTLFYSDEQEPTVERDEQWVGDGASPEPRGIADVVLIDAFGYLLLLRELVVAGEPMNMKGMMTVAMAHSETPFGRKIAKSLIKKYVDEMDIEELREWWNDQN